MLLSMIKEPRSRPQKAADELFVREHVIRWDPTRGAQKRLAEETGLSEGQISQILNDGSFSRESLRRVAKALGCKSVRDLYYLPEEAARIDDFLAGIRASRGEE